MLRSESIRSPGIGGSGAAIGSLPGAVAAARAAAARRRAARPRARAASGAAGQSGCDHGRPPSRRRQGSAAGARAASGASSAMKMRALRIARAGAPLALEEIPLPEPGPGELRLRVTACGVCRTDLHLLDGELPGAAEPIVPGHQIVGRVDRVGAGVREFALGRPGRRALARRHLRRVPLLRERPREPLRCGGVHGLPARRRLRRVRGGRRALLRADSRCARRRRGGAAPVRGRDRIPLPAPGGRRRDARLLRLRRGRAPRDPGRAPRAAGACSRSRARATSTRSASRASSARNGPARPTPRLPSRSTPRSCSRRSARSCPRRCARSTRAAR